MLQLSLNQARSFILECQLLAGRRPPLRKKGTLAVIEHLGYIQIDTISVIARAHHHVLWTRVKGYQEEYLTQLEQEKKVFEYWSHAASYLPMKDYRFSLFPKEKIRRGPGHWRPRDKKWTKFVYDRIKAEGPLQSKDFKKDKVTTFDHAWGGDPITQALRQLFMEGMLMISGRKGFQKIYDLTERVIPESVNQVLPTKEEYFNYLIQRDLRANGVMTAGEIGHLINIPRKDLLSILNIEIEKKKISQVHIKGLPEAYYALSGEIFEFKNSRRQRKMYLLSPFDNLIIQRNRIHKLFGFEYTLECYVPAAKRKVGYFVLPILSGGKFIGQIDLKADRKRKELIIKNLVWEKNYGSSNSAVEELKKSLERFMAFNQCDMINAAGFLG